MKRDLTGMRFGRLTALEETSERSKSGSIVWLCQCDCGRQTRSPGAQLTQGYKKSCGCLGHPPLKDYVGKRFGALTVIGYVGKEAGIHRWRCRCDCGREKTVRQNHLQNGKTKSCGCVQRRVIVDNLRLVEGTSLTMLESGRGRRLRSNTSGVTGVYRNAQGKWAAQITFKGKTHYLGTYAALEEAASARRRAEEMHNDFLAAHAPEQKKKPDASGRKMKLREKISPDRADCPD